MQDWEYPIDSHMIEQMASSETAGYVPLCSVLHWIMTEGGEKPKFLEDKQSWEAAIGRLFPLIETEEIRIVGRRRGAQSKSIKGIKLVGVRFGSPLQESLDLILGESPWISFAPYIDKEHWEGGFNDCLYLTKVGHAEWTHLQLRKADVLRSIAFDVGDKSGGQSFKTKDDALILEMRELITVHKAKNVTDAARMIASKAQSLGTPESTIERLRRGYGRKYPTRKRR